MQHVATRRLQILDIEPWRTHLLQVLGERGNDVSPLPLAVGERLVSTQILVVRPEQHPQIPRHTRPQR
ncbi:hypothetical protein ACFQ6B_27315 [Streptomyces wedmorensis]|uniref:Uncharacterized protein n=1 Tax=Streptomyces wedmorensis TaxID=43759 RepID=A0ABW6IP43_STRWE